MGIDSGMIKKMTAQEIGAIRREFKPALENIIAGMIIGLLMIGGGCAAIFFPVKGVIDSRGSLPFWAEKGWSWGVLGLASLLGIAVIAGGIFTRFGGCRLPGVLASEGGCLTDCP